MKKDKNLTNTSPRTVKDLYYKTRKERLHVLRKDIKSGNEIMYDFDVSMDELITALSKSTF